MLQNQPKILTFTGIHETAVIAPNAIIGKNVKIGPFAVIGNHVVIGDGTIIGAHSVIEGWTTLGKACTISPQVSIGTEPQDKKFRGERSYVSIGDNTQIREFVTINRATGEDEETRIGSNCLLLTSCHIGHNCVIGNNVFMSSAAMLAGHVELEDWVTMGTTAGIHQFVRIGQNAMIGTAAKVVQDVPPFVTLDGDPAQAIGLNTTGMARAGVDRKTMQILNKAYKILYLSGQRLPDAIMTMAQELPLCKELEIFISFLHNTERGICRSAHKSKKFA